MSYFCGDVIAKEQLFGVVGTSSMPAPTAPPPTGGVFRQRRRPRRMGKTTFELFRDYLEFKVKQHDTTYVL